MHKSYIRNLFDLLLYEEGCFSILNCFLKEGYLDYDVYQNWRAGKIDYLEHEFTCSSETCSAFFAEVNGYASILGVDREPVDYLSTGGQTLHFSPNPQRDTNYKTLFTPSSDRVQLDLFFDSAESGLTDDLTHAVVNGETQRIEYLLSALRRVNSKKAQQFEHILRTKDAIVANALSIDEKLRLMERELTLPVLELMGHWANDLLIPLWQEFADEFSDRIFDPKKPKYHASYCAFKGLQWRKVLHAIEKERNWRRQPILLFRYAEANFKLQNELEGLNSWFHLFLSFPETASKKIAQTGYRLLQEDWRQFQTLDPEMENDLFPAWVLIKKPMLSRYAFDVDEPSASTKAFTHVLELLQTAESRLDRKAIALRAELKRCCPTLFVHFINLR